MRTSGAARRLTSRAGAVSRSPRGGLVEDASALERCDRAARYALVVSIRAPEVDVDLRTEVANQIGVAVAIET